jgi:hypothetical protein
MDPGSRFARRGMTEENNGEQRYQFVICRVHCVKRKPAILIIAG